MYSADAPISTNEQFLDCCTSALSSSCPPWAPSAPDHLSWLAYSIIWTLHTQNNANANMLLHTTHCIMYTAHLKLKAVYFTLITLHFTLHCLSQTHGKQTLHTVYCSVYWPLQASLMHSALFVWLHRTYCCKQTTSIILQGSWILDGWRVPALLCSTV